MQKTHTDDPTALLQDVLAHPERYPDDFVVLRRDTGLLARAFSGESVRLLRTLDNAGPTDVTSLAARLGRDRTRVSKDVHFLAGLGLVRTRREGRRTLVSATHAMVLVA